MPITFTCRQCAQALTVPDDLASPVVRCPFCQTVQEYPRTPAPPPAPAPQWKPPEQEFFETGNPFQPPVEVEDDPYTHGDMVAQRVSLGKLFNDVFALYQRHFGTMVLIALIVMGVNTVAGQIPNLAQLVLPLGWGPEAYVCLLIPLHIIGNIFTLWVTLGGWRAVLDLARGGNSLKTSLLFPPADMTLKIVLVRICQLLLLAVFAIPAVGILIPFWYDTFMAMQGGGAPPEPPTEAIVATIIVGLAYGIATWFFWARLSWADFFVFDRGQGIFESLFSSWRFTRGNVPVAMFSLFIFPLIAVIGILLCCVGVILTFSISPTFFVLFYLMMTGQPSVFSMPGSPLPNGIPSR